MALRSNTPHNRPTNSSCRTSCIDVAQAIAAQAQPSDRSFLGFCVLKSLSNAQAEIRAPQNDSSN